MLGSLFFTVASGATWPVPGAQLVKRSERTDGVLLVAEQKKRRQVWADPDLPCFFAQPLQSRFVYLTERLKQARKSPKF